jgi:hypothetical protein
MSGVACSNLCVGPPARSIAEPSKQTSPRTGPSRAPSSPGKAISPVHRSRFASWQSGSCWQTRQLHVHRSCRRDVVQVDWGERYGAQDSACCYPNVTKRLKQKVPSLWPPTARTLVLDTAATVCSPVLPGERIRGNRIGQPTLTACLISDAACHFSCKHWLFAAYLRLPEHRQEHMNLGGRWRRTAWRRGVKKNAALRPAFGVTYDVECK